MPSDPFALQSSENLGEERRQWRLETERPRSARMLQSHNTRVQQMVRQGHTGKLGRATVAQVSRY